MSENLLRGLLGALALVGAAISAYLLYNHLAGTAPACVGGSGGCASVQTSRYSEIAGVPVAVLGLIAYAGLLISAAMEGEKAVLAGLFISLVGTLFSAYLTYLELFVIGAICQWCVASAVVILGCLALAAARLRAPVKRRT